MKFRYKPLWMIHNRTYRHYKKGLNRKRFVRYLNKAKKILFGRG